MKYGILTYYNVLNHGAILQLYGLIQTLKSFGIEAKALRFERNYDYTDKSLRSKYKVGVNSIIYYIKFLHNRGLKNFIFLYNKKKILDKFKIEKRLIGSYYHDNNRCDAIIIGSDEVFSLYTGLTPALFGYDLPLKKIFAYAGCFGPTTIEDIDKKKCREYIRDGLNCMCGISMRDNNSVDICENLLGYRPILVCDPVLLYGFMNELQDVRRPIDEKYIVVYAYDNNMNETSAVDTIKSFAKERGLIIVSPGFYHKWVDKNINIDPIELLQWFQYADFVVTDTFHGCVMSLITSREMAVKVRDNGNKLNSLLDQYGISNRQINDSWDLDFVFSQPIDWDDVNERLLNHRNVSMQYLDKMIRLE